MVSVIGTQNQVDSANKMPRKRKSPILPKKRANPAAVIAMQAARRELLRSGNPLSLAPHLYKEMLHLARDASPVAVRRLIALMDSPDERIAIIAADKVLERAWGKPKDFEPDKAGSAAPDLSKLSSADLADLRRIAGKVRGVDVPSTESLPNAGEDTAETAAPDAESGPTIDAEAIEMPEEPAAG